MEQKPKVCIECGKALRKKGRPFTKEKGQPRKYCDAYCRLKKYRKDLREKAGVSSQKVCPGCGKPIRGVGRPLSDDVGNEERYCSARCPYQLARKGPTTKEQTECNLCGGPIRNLEKPRKTKRGRPRKYCSESCSALGWIKENPDKHAASVRKARLKGKFGITLDIYEGMLADQKWSCAICEETCASGRRLAVDHDHKSGKIRGLLCSRCNQAIGKFEDNPTFLRAAASYLERT